MAKEGFSEATEGLLHEVDEHSRRVLLGDFRFSSIPEAERTGLDEETTVVARGEDWTQYSDGEVLYWDDGIPFYLE
ncbi:MAG TPA: hypothetical protein VK694_01925 [Verrucomicrobiae bacterium]|nr:hypothetical protein [Verrucomicrobiae bacterium]